MKLPEKKYTSLSNLFVQMVYFKDTEREHKIKKNKFTSFALLASGAVEVTVNKIKTIFEAPHIICIPANKELILKPKVPDTVLYNIHALRDKEGYVINPEDVPGGVDLEEFGLSSELLEDDRSN